METPNLKYLKQISGGDLDFENSLLTILKVEFPLEYKTIKYNFKHNNYKLLALNIHKIKHKIGMLSMDKGVDLASICEINIKEGITEQYNDLILILDRIDVYLKNK